MERIETPRLVLRPFRARDTEAIHAVWSDPEVMRWVGHGPVAGVSASERMLRGYAEHQRAQGYSFWAVVERSSDTLIGDAGLHRTPAGETELGYTLGVPWWGQGYATEAARAWLDAAFGPLELPEVVALAEPANAGSLHVLEKVGMVAAGRRVAFGRDHLRFRIARAGS